MNAVVVDHKLVVDPQSAAVIAGGVERIIAFGRDVQKAFEADGAIVERPWI